MQFSKPGKFVNYRNHECGRGRRPVKSLYESLCNHSLLSERVHMNGD